MFFFRVLIQTKREISSSLTKKKNSNNNKETEKERKKINSDRVRVVYSQVSDYYFNLACNEHQIIVEMPNLFFSLSESGI